MTDDGIHWHMEHESSMPHQGNTFELRMSSMYAYDINLFRAKFLGKPDATQLRWTLPGAKLFCNYIVAEDLENFWRVNKQSQWFKDHPILHDEPCQCVIWRAGTGLGVCTFLETKVVLLGLVGPNWLRILIYGIGFLWWSMEMTVMHTGDEVSMW